MNLQQSRLTVDLKSDIFVSTSDKYITLLEGVI